MNLFYWLRLFYIIAGEEDRASRCAFQDGTWWRPQRSSSGTLSKLMELVRKITYRGTLSGSAVGVEYVRE